MSELFGQLGVDWRLLLSQAINFSILFAVLTVFIYRPLIRLIKERASKIKLGLEGAAEAERRLGEIDLLKQAKMTETEREALQLLNKAEEEAMSRGNVILASAEEKARAREAEEEKILDQKRREEIERTYREAAGLVRSALVKTVELDPSKIDEKLIRGAIESLRSERRI